MLDADSADFRVQQNAYINMQDFRFGPTSDKGFAEQLEAVGGTIIITNDGLPAGQNYCIGVAYEYSKRRAIFFIWNENGNHGIYCYDYVHNHIDPVLLAADFPDGLNFSRFDLIHSARAENGCVYWTDNFNQPRRLSIQAAIEMYITPGTPPIGYMVNTLPLYSSNIDPTGNSFKPGFIVFDFSLPIAPVPSYGSGGLSIFLRWTGANGQTVTSSVVTPAWHLYPSTPANVLVADAVIDILSTLGPRGVNWDVFNFVSSNAVPIYINPSWDFATGNPAFAPTSLLELVMDYFIYNDGNTPLAYTSPVSGAVIAWIRRQPGLPPNALKVIQTSPALSSNLIAGEAFEFCYRFIYRDGELSTLSGYSRLQNFNADADAFNRIDITIPFAEKIDQDVMQIDLVARYLISGIFFVIHSWRTAVPDDEIAINLHNGGEAQLSYAFYNDVAGIALDSAYSNKPFDSVPVLAQTIEMAKQRAFMGNITLGYDAPTISSLAVTTSSITLTTSGGTTVNGTWYLLQWNVGRPGAGSNSAYVVQTATKVHPTDPFGSLYYYTYSGTVPPFPGLVNAAQLTFQGNTQAQAAQAIQGPQQTSIVILTSQGANVVINIGTVPSTGAILAKVFKSFASYQVGISFRDRYGRECGVTTSPSLTIATPDIFSTNTTNYNFISGINWTLSNANSFAEIPPWAYYYNVLITLCLRTRFFVEGIGLAIYAAKDSDNNYTFTTDTYASTLAGVAIDISGLNSYAQGYVLSQGDAARVYVNNAYQSLSIVAQVAQYIVCQLADVGTLTNVTCHYEIYTPYQRQSNEPFFEISQCFQVTSAGDVARQYSVAAGSLSGDVYVFTRGGYITEGMNATDKYYSSWFTDAGRPDFIDYIGQVQHPTSIAFSNTFISGAQNNGLSTFDALDTQDISPDFGPIQKLQLASKVSKIGTVMLAICSGPTTASIYLGENTLISQTGDSVVAQGTSVIGSIHELKGSFGTLNPESVVEFRGSIYWFDVQNGMIVQYADNGLFPVSNYKMSRYWKLFSDTYKSISTNQVEAFGNRPYIFGGVDPHHGEILFSVPKVLAVPPNGFLLDHPSTPYPFDIWDGLGKTLVYKLYTDPNHWQGAYSFSPDYMMYLEDNLFSFKSGQLYLHNQTNYCNYYGQQVDPMVMGIANQNQTRPKSWNNFSAEANEVPVFVYFMSLYPNQQASELVDFQFTNLEGIWYSPILRNKFDPAVSNLFQGLLIGEKMRTTALYYLAQWKGGGLVQVKFVNLGYTLSLGQKT